MRVIAERGNSSLHLSTPISHSVDTSLDILGVGMKGVSHEERNRTAILKDERTAGAFARTHQGTSTMKNVSSYLITPGS